MKNTLYLITILASFLVTISSCKKETSQEQPETIDSMKSILPKQIIINYPSQLSLLEDKVISFKYDTANYKIELYRDDTTNTNPYDELLATYTFNKDGYLIKSTGLELYEFSDETDVIINRTADNKITSIIYHYADDDDATFTFKYEPLTGGTKITTAYNFGYEPDTAIYEYSNDGRILSIPVFQGTQNMYYPPATNDQFTYTYNADKGLTGVTRAFYGQASNKMKMDYSSGIPVSDKDWLSELLLGKDYYLLNLSVLNPFSFFVAGEIDPFIISATNRNHVSHIEETSSFESNVINATMTYQFNDKNLLSSVVLTSVNSQYGTFITSMRFKY